MERHSTATVSADGSASRFGRVPLTAARIAFRKEMNREMMALLRSLPASAHAGAVVALMEHFRTPFFPEFDYFRNYHAPAWSILYWLEQMGAVDADAHRHALGAHAMALFLHPLDDHLSDGQLPPTHLHLLLRSQAWQRMNAALEPLAAKIPSGGGIVRSFIDDYYASIDTSPAAATLDGYCVHFRRQMATWMIAPALLSARVMPDRSFAQALQSAFGAFGTAWRLVDDLQDVSADLAAGSHSAIYYLLPPEIRPLWDQASPPGALERQQAIHEAVFREGIMERLRSRVLRELASAAQTAAAIEMSGLAEELDCLARPLADGQAPS